MFFLHMSRKITAVLELQIAMGALKTFLVTVGRFQMIPQPGSIDETLVTLGTRMVPDIVMDSFDMFSKFVRRAEAFLALLASVIPDIHVDVQDVFLKESLEHEAFIAQMTMEIPGLLMRSLEMRGQVAFITECLAADVALEIPDVFMNTLHMLISGFSGEERLTALLTREVPDILMDKPDMLFLVHFRREFLATNVTLSLIRFNQGGLKEIRHIHVVSITIMSIMDNLFFLDFRLFLRYGFILDIIRFIGRSTIF